MSTTLSQRGQENVVGLDLPWRFAPAGKQRYHKDLNPSGLISFATAENAKVQEELAKYVAEKVTIPPEAFLYGYSTNGGPRFRDAMASFINEQFHPFMPISESNILVGGSVTSMENILAFSIGDPGDAVLVSSPIYGRFELDFGNQARLKIVYAPMEGVDSFKVDVVGQYEKAIVEANENGTKIRALLISNPSNPLGQCYPKETLRGLMVLCQKHHIHLISDEIYALSVFDTGNADAVPFTSVLSFDATGLIDDDLLHVLYGMSKDFGAPGLRIGCLITRSIPVYRACSTLSRFHNPSGASLAIGSSILEDREFHRPFLALCRARLLEGYKLTTSILDEANIPYGRSGNAGLFVYLDLSSWLPKNKSGRDEEFDLAQRFVDHGIFLHPGEEHCEEAGRFRLVFASLTEEELREGLRRLRAALDSASST